MKNFYSYLLCVVAFLLCQQSFGQVQWYGDPDKSITTVFRRFDTNVSAGQSNCSPLSEEDPTATAVNDGTYGKVWEIRKNRNRKRAEFARTRINGNQWDQPNNSTYYYGWRWKISSADNINEKITVWQWKTNDTSEPTNYQNYPLDMDYANGKLNLNAYAPNENSNGDYIQTRISRPDGSIYSGQSDRRTTIWSKDVAEDEWVRLVIRIGTSKTNGKVEVWFNGLKQVLTNTSGADYQVSLSNDKKTATHRTFDGKQMYCKWGIYNLASCPWDVSTFYDEMRAAATRIEAEPKTYDDGGSSGGGITGKWYRMKNVMSGDYLDADGSGSLKVGASSSGFDKQWRFVLSAGNNTYNIDSRISGRGVLEVQGSNSVKWISTQPVSTPDDREWILESVAGNKYRFKNKFNNSYLAQVSGGGSSIQTTSWNGSRSQWTLEENTSKESFVKKEVEYEEVSLNISVYPNPATSSFTVNVKGMDEELDISIFDLSGREVYQSKIVGDKLLISSSKFSTGVYIIKTTDIFGNTVTKKLVVQ